MSSTRATTFHRRISSIQRNACISLFFLLTPCTIWSYQSTVSFIKAQRVRAHYISTTCLLHNYTLLRSQSDHCGTAAFTTTNCFDEHISLIYPIFNRTLVSTTITISNTHLRHKPSEIGSSSICFYHTKHVSSVMLELPSEMSSLVQLIMASALLLLPLSMIAMAWICKLVSKLAGYRLHYSEADDDYTNF